MNIVYLIGNGFDLNLGMETGYRDFYKYYKSLPMDNDPDVVKTFKQELWSNIENWSDLELSLGKYLRVLGAQDAIVLWDNLIDDLANYIELEEKKHLFNETQKNIFFEYLSNPYDRLLPTERKEFNKYTQRWLDSNWHVNLITFNYTLSIR